MKIYFAGSIRGGRKDANLYHQIIEHLSMQHTVFTEHIGDDSINWQGEKNITDEYIYKRDMNWLGGAEALIAEISTPSLGVGYELAIAEKLSLPVLCIYKLENKKISAMISGNKSFYCKKYLNLSDAIKYIDSFLLNI